MTLAGLTLQPRDWTISMFSVCFLVTALDPVGGAEMQVANLAKALRDRAWQVTVISMLPEGHGLATELRAAGVHVATLSMKKGTPDPRAIWRLAKMIRVLKPDILHAHMVAANLLARATRLVAPVPLVISTAHNIHEGGRMYDLAYRLTDRLGDVTTNVSRAAACRYARDGLVPQNRLRVMVNGIDVDRFRPSQTSRLKMRSQFAVEDMFVWLAIGRLREQKDYPNMLRAFAGLSRPRSVLLIAGEGELRPELELMAQKLTIADRVRFCGFCQNSAGLLNVADGFVLSSRWEGLPLILLEAAATALPIVATDVGGNAEIVQHGTTGFLVAAAESAALRRSMQTVMETPEKTRREMGEAGRAFVLANYSMSRVVFEWENLYREFLEAKNAVHIDVSSANSPI